MLSGNTTMFVSVASSLTDILFVSAKYTLQIANMSVRTDFATGDSLIVCVWKLKGLRGGGGPIMTFPASLNAGLSPLPVEDRGEAIEPNRPEKVSVMGERELGSKVIVERTVRETPSIPRPEVLCSSTTGVGGVGVRGGAGMGRLEAIAADH